MRQLARRLWTLLRRRRFEADLAEEMAFHREMTRRDLEASGVPPADARRAASRALGSVALAADRARDVWRPRWLQGIGHDLRLAVRTLRLAPVVSAAAMLSLALGIGANAAIFSLLDSLLLRALPVPRPERLVAVSTPRIMSLGTRAAGFPNPVWEQIRQRALFDGAIAWSTTRLNLTTGGEEAVVEAVWADGGFFDTLGVPAFLGRTLSAADDRRGGGPDGPVTVISYGFWQGRFGGSPDVIGRSLTLEGVPFTIVGVTPPDFFGVDVGSRFDVVVPIGVEARVRGAESGLDNPQFYWLSIMGRLKPGQTMEAAAAALRGVQPDIRRVLMPANLPAGARAQFLAEPFTLIPASTGNSYLRGRYARALTTIMVVVGLVLLIACANVANLLLARVSSRQWELSVRLALGSSRWRLARQLLLESAVLASAGLACGLAVAVWASRLLVRGISTRDNPVFLNLSLDWRVLAFTMGVAAATTLVCGVAPAIRASGTTPMNALRERGRTGSTPRAAMAGAFVVAQIALSLMLVVAAGLMVRTFASLATRPLGFDRDRSLLVTVNAARAATDPPRRKTIYPHLREEVAKLPGVASAALSAATPVMGGGIILDVEVQGGRQVPRTLVGGIANAYANVVSTEWFATIGTPIVAGRGFDTRDRAGTARVVVVNEALARAFLGDVSPVGRTLMTNVVGGKVQLEIVGVAADTVYGSIREAAAPIVYMPLSQAEPMIAGGPFMFLVVRAVTTAPAALAKTVLATAAGVQPGLRLTARPLADQLEAALTQERVLAMLSGFFGALALLLAAIGLFGVTSYAVSQRRGELGVRMALGATPDRVMRLVLSRVVTLVAAGVVAGGVASLWASRFVATLLYGITPRDPATFIVAVAALAAVAFAAGTVPAWRAAHVDPARVLRDE